MNDGLSFGHSTGTVSAESVYNVPRLRIPSESASSSSNSSGTEEDVQSVVREKVDIENAKTTTEESNQTEPHPCEWKPQILNSEQASLSWTCDIFSKESDQFALGWASQINSDSINCSGDGEPREPKITTYSPLEEIDFQESATPPVDDSRGKLAIEYVHPKPEYRRNFIRQNILQVKAKGSSKDGSYSQLIMARVQPTVKTPPDIERVSFSNLPNSTTKLEYLLQEQRMDLIHEMDDFLKEHSQDTTQQSETLGEVVKAKQLSQAKLLRRPVKLVDFKNLDKHVKREWRSYQPGHLGDELHSSWHQDLASVKYETNSLKLPVPSEASIQAKEISPSGNVLSNHKKYEHVKNMGEPKRAKSKREIMKEYSKSVSAANTIQHKKALLKRQLKLQMQPTKALDNELAKILQAHEIETQRIASLFLS